MMLMRTWKTVVCSIAAGLCLGATSVAKADTIAYMSANSGQFGATFGTIDLNTGVFSSLGNNLPVALSGMAEANGTLYGADEGTTNNGGFYTINPANGALTKVGTTGISYDDLGSTLTGVYAVDSFGKLYSINAATGAATPIGSGGIPVAGFSALSTNASTLYYADGNNLYTLNTTIGAATLIGSLGDSIQLTALLLENGTLYGTPDGNPLSVATVGPASGATTIGPDITGAGTGLITGLAPYPLAVPAPAIGHGLPVVLAVGGVLFGAKLLERSRKRRLFGAAIPHAAA
jgi:hypothetical protein